MLDDLRSSSGSPFAEDEEEPTFEEQDDLGAPPPAEPAQPFLGMTAPQRFVVMLLLLLAVCLIGTFLLILTGKVVP